MTDMKTCHHCHTDFPSGITCPSCHAFVPDAAPEDVALAAPEARRAWESTGGTSASAPAPAETEGPKWAVIAPNDPPLAETPTVSSAADAAGPSTTSLVPVTYPAWARVRDEVAPPTPADTTFASTWAQPPDWRPPTPTHSGGSPPGAPVPGAYSGPNGTKPPTFTLTPATLAFAIGALVVIMLIGAYVILPKGSSGQPEVAGDIAGSCFDYSADHSTYERTVPCDGSHDAIVLAFAGNQTACPTGTDAILTTRADTYGQSGVLCVDDG